MSSSNGNVSRVIDPFVWGIHRSPVDSPHKGQWRGALMLSLIWASINDWRNNREAGDLRRHRAHYDVIVIQNGCYGADKNAFPWMKITVCWFKFHWNPFLWRHLTISQHWFRWWLGACSAPSHYLNQYRPSSLTHKCVILPQWVTPRYGCLQWLMVGSDTLAKLHFRNHNRLVKMSDYA